MSNAERNALVTVETMDRLVAQAVERLSAQGDPQVLALLGAAREEAQMRMATAVKVMAVSDEIAGVARARVARVLEQLPAVEAPRGVVVTVYSDFEWSVEPEGAATVVYANAPGDETCGCGYVIAPNGEGGWYHRDAAASEDHPPRP